MAKKEVLHKKNPLEQQMGFQITLKAGSREMLDADNRLIQMRHLTPLPPMITNNLIVRTDFQAISDITGQALSTFRTEEF